ncbi:MAG: glycosyltransferase family 4 protein [Lachnospiraceae bacterium]|nr:glycosyltransferase family 4 protein [Lachnospiraceae bacterium]
MNILFLTLADFVSIEERNIYTDLLRKFYIEGHCVSIISPVERRKKVKTTYLKTEERLNIVKLRIGNIQKTNKVEKGISMITLETLFIKAVKKYYGNIKFDLVLYSTPPITLQKAVNYVKKRDQAVTYLMLKDIFPQNAVDLGMLTKRGVKGVLYRYFRKKEERLYKDSDYIGCMSQANITYIKRHNPKIGADKIELCPNCIEPIYQTVSEKEKKEIREKLGIPVECHLFLYGGNLGKPQGIPFLVQCLKCVKGNSKVYFLVIGNGTEYKKLEAFIKAENPENVKLMKELPKEDYDKIVPASDIGMIFLDHRFSIPNFPSRILSYMQAGIPVLALTDTSTDIGEVIERGKFGVSVKSNRTEDFIRGMNVLLSEKDLSELGKNGVDYLESHYTVQVDYDIIMSHFAGRE